MGSEDRRLRREFDVHVDTIMDYSSKKAAFAADPDWKSKAYGRWRAEREERFAAAEPPAPEPISGFALECEMRSIIEFCEGFLEGFEDDDNQVGVVEMLQRIRALPPA
ncbi:hypothetical protein J7E62_24625 [Variovorax paradoxus]|nr:hypothetical protein [Variovorax paradoxus]